MEIGDYRVIAMLGRGRMAEVFLAVRRGLVGSTKLVVLKRLREDVCADDYGKQLLDDTRLAARLHHPNIVQTFRGDRDAGAPFVAMEYLDGQSLDRVLQAVCSSGSGAFATDFTVLVLCDVLSALEYAHNLCEVDGSPLGIVHRDVSPHNIFVTYRGDVKLVDFGVAKHIGSGSDSDTELSLVRGELTYVAPEQTEHRSVDRRADLFSVGVVMWECLALRGLFAAQSPVATLNASRYEPLPPLAAMRPDLDPALASICNRALDRDPARRYPSAAAMRAELQALVLDRDATRAALARSVAGLFAAERTERAALIQRAFVGDASVSRTQLELAAQCDASFASDRETRLNAPPPAALTTFREPPVPQRARLAVGLLAALLLGALTLMVVRWGAPLLPLLAAAVLPPPTPIGNGSAWSSETVLRLCGSNTIGAELAPALIEAFLKHQKGASAVSRRPGPNSEVTTIVAALGDERVSVEISARGTATGFAGLAAGVCDVGMASRAMREDEAESLRWRGYGELRSPGAEHVIALDGIAVVVHPNNPLRALDRVTLHDIFTGKIARWVEVGGRDEPITVLARDDASGTFDTFSALVLGRDALTPRARRYAQSDALSDAVASDPSAIGFVGLPYVRAARALALGEAGTTPMLPTQFTVATEDYLLSRRLYLYTLPRPRTHWVTEFISFALSRAAQEVAAESQFIDLELFTQAGECSGQCPPRYAALAATAQRVSVDFRFRSGSDALDGRAERDLDRVVGFLSDHRDANPLLFGFADASGGPAANLKLSSDRAKAIEQELAVRGIHAAIVIGFGSAMPLASNETAGGRERNRRVEVWIQR